MQWKVYYFSEFRPGKVETSGTQRWEKKQLRSRNGPRIDWKIGGVVRRWNNSSDQMANAECFIGFAKISVKSVSKKDFSGDEKTGGLFELDY